MARNSTWILKKTENPIDMYEQLVNTEKKADRRYKVFATVSIFGFIGSLIAMIYALNLPRTVPVLVSVSDWGEAKYLGDVSKISYQGITIPEVAIEYQLRKFVNNLYSVPNDPEVLTNNIIDCYSCLTSESASKLSNILRADNPLEKYDNKRKTVNIESIISLSKNSYQVDFLVTTTDNRGGNSTKNRYRGVLTTVLLEPSEEDKILNPLGIYIQGFDFKEIK